MYTNNVYKGNNVYKAGTFTLAFHLYNYQNIMNFILFFLKINLS